MSPRPEDFDIAHNEKLKRLSKEERAKAGLKKLAQVLATDSGQIREPRGLASGASDPAGKMIIELAEDDRDEP